MQLNLKLREDLTKSFENHIRLLSQVEQSNSEKDQLRIEVGSVSRARSVEVHALNTRIKLLESQVGDLDERMERSVAHYEGRLSGMK